MILIDIFVGKAQFQMGRKLYRQNSVSLEYNRETKTENLSFKETRIFVIQKSYIAISCNGCPMY